MSIVGSHDSHGGAGRHQPPADWPSRSRLARAVALLVAVAAGSYVVAAFTAARVPDGSISVSQVGAGTAVFVLLAASGSWLLVLQPLARGFAATAHDLTIRSRSIEDRLRARENDARLQHALEISEDQSAVLRIAQQALQVMPGVSISQLLLADDPDTEIRHVVTTGDMPPEARCMIKRPSDCPTVRWGQGMVYEDAMALSACPGLGGQIDPGCAAACTPIIVAGRGTGMMRSLGTTGDPDLYRTLQALSTHANRIGTRLAVIRSVAASEMKASTDPLTGLANRRTLDLRLSALLGRQEPFALAIIDVDHFKQVNDTHGHDTGDRVLKMLASALLAGVRRDDLVCRFGGEEFVLVLPGTDIGRAAEVVEAARAELPRSAAKAGLPAVTISAGIVDQGFGPDAEDLLRTADELLYQAKRDGRDRVVIAQAA